MRIKSLSISNFRSIKQLTGFELPPICALIGPNNAGKSNILEAVRRVLAPDWGPRVRDFTEDDVYLRDPSLDIRISVTFDAPISYAKIKGAKPVGIATFDFGFTRYKIGENKGQRRLDQNCYDENGSVPTVQASRFQRGHQPRFEPVVGIPQAVRDQVPFIYIGTNRSLREQMPGARYSLLRSMLEDVNRGLHDPSEVVMVERSAGTSEAIPRVQRFRELMEQALALLRTKEFEALESAIKRNALEQLGLDAGADDIDMFFTPMNTFDFYKSLDLVIREGQFEISATDVGEGMQNAIVLAILRAFEETRRHGAIILIEEPEIFLHPQMQRSLYATLRRIGETNQVIYTTHSAQFVSVPDYRDIVLVRRDRASGTSTMQSNLPDATWRREKLRQMVDQDRSEFFFSSKVLIVEGDTEKLALPEFAKKIPVDLNRAGATILEVGGKKNLFDFAELAISLGISTGVLYDKDSSEFKNKVEEAQYNSKLDTLAKPDGSVRVWRLDQDYESYVRREIGGAKLETIMNRYPTEDYGKGKPRRQRMLAADSDMPVPMVFEEILRWLVANWRLDC